FLLLAQGPDRPIVLAEGGLDDDRAVGEDVEVSLGHAPGVYSLLRAVRQEGGTGYFELLVTNDRAAPVVFEGGLHFRRVRADRRLAQRNGNPLWRVTVPANGSARLCFRAQLGEDYELSDQAIALEATCFQKRR